MIQKIKNIFSLITSLSKNKLADDFSSSILTINYKEIEVYYSENTSIVNRIIQTGEYEPEVILAIKNQLPEKKDYTILDIGANIGLISVALLDSFPDAKIYAFEPGPHQNSLFKKTIEKNKLNSIQLSPIALSNEKGTATFRVHSSTDASGDGFIDTKRAGPTRSILVKTDTLDNWWNENNKPKIDFIKMDTEGSEYFILQGATTLVKLLKPKMLIEINLQNIKNYPFSVNDLFEQIKKLNYQIYSLDNILIPFENVAEHSKKTDTFLLKSIH